MPEKIFHLKDIGEVKIRKNKRSKNVSISLRPQKGIIVTLPYFVSYKYGLQFLEKKKAWIEKNLPKIRAIEKKAIVFDENTSFKTRTRELVIQKHSSEKLIVNISSNQIQIFYPETISVEHPEVQDTIKNSIIRAFRSEAKEYLPNRTKEIAQKLNFKYNRIFIKNNKTLWGSCSAINNINLNLHLMRLPSHLIDYVIIHELCHTVEKNHGPHFWKLMDSILGNAKLLSKELRQYSIVF